MSCTTRGKNVKKRSKEKHFHIRSLGTVNLACQSEHVRQLTGQGDLIENKNDFQLKKAKQCAKIFCECEEYQITRGPWTATAAWIKVEDIVQTIIYKRGKMSKAKNIQIFF